MGEINPQDLIAKFQYAIANNWGYIWGTAGELWTAAKQAQLERTTDSDRAMGRKYGKKWIGHYVADCSGMFTWAFKQLGGYMYHGSDTMYRKYTTSKGELKSGKRSDGQELKAGTAVFTYNAKKKNYGHVGLYIGGGKVIEAEGTIKGVITSNVNGKWTNWGELKGVNYGSEPGPSPTPTPTPTPTPGHAVVTGVNVALRQGPSTNTPVIVRIPTDTIVDISQVEGWTYVRYNGKVGFMMNEFINVGEASAKVTGKNVALRAGPSTDDNVILRIKTGTVVMRETLPSDWECIAYNGKKGFMMKQFIKEG